MLPLDGDKDVEQAGGGRAHRRRRRKTDSGIDGKATMVLPLHVDICDCITEFLHESPSDLKAWALVSRACTSSAQRYLFREVDVGWDEGVDPNGKALRAAQRLCAILGTSPHLIRLVRDLSLSLELFVEIASIQFTHVESLILCATLTTPLSRDIVSLAAGLAALPSLHRLELSRITFPDMESLRSLFALRTSPLDRLSLDDVQLSEPPIDDAGVNLDTTQHRILLKEAKLSAFNMNSQDPAWLLHPLCPFDFSALTGLHIDRRITPSLTQLMHSTRSSLHSLTLDIGMSALFTLISSGIGFYEGTRGFSLLAFPALRVIDFLGGFDDGSYAISLLETVTANNVIEHINIRISIFESLNHDSLRRIDDTISACPMSALRTVRIVFSRASPWSVPQGDEFIVHTRGLRRLFPKLDTRGCLRLACVLGMRKYPSLITPLVN
jgi:hypothetical protein